MRGFFLVALFLLGWSQLEAQPVRDTAWNKAGFFGLKLTQVSLSSWSAGGESAMAFDSQITYSQAGSSIMAESFGIGVRFDKE